MTLLGSWRDKHFNRFRSFLRGVSLPATIDHSGSWQSCILCGLLGLFRAASSEKRQHRSAKIRLACLTFRKSTIPAARPIVKNSYCDSSHIMEGRFFAGPWDRLSQNYLPRELFETEPVAGSCIVHTAYVNPLSRRTMDIS